MDEKFIEFFSLRSLLFEIATMRQLKYYQKLIKETYRAEMENLRNVEIELYNQKVKLDDTTKWPIPKHVPVPEVNVQEPLDEYNEIISALDCLK